MNVLIHNMQSIYTNRQLCITNNNISKSTEKLSSGYKINRAADDAAGLAISEGMRRKIRGLTQGTNNTQDGISLCQIADGALAEVSDMMHRLTELSVQSANATNTPEDRMAIQEEVNQLLEEIDRTSTSTRFNTLPIFSESADKSKRYMSRSEAMAELASGTIDSTSSDITNLNGDVILSKEAANAIFGEMSCYYAVDNLYRDYIDGIIPYDGKNGDLTKKMADVMRMFADTADAIAIWEGYGPDSGIGDIMRADVELYQNADVAGWPSWSSAAAYARDYCRGVPGLARFDAVIISFSQIPEHAADYYDWAGTPNGEQDLEALDICFPETQSELLKSMKVIATRGDEIDPTLERLSNGLSDKESIADLYAYLHNVGKEIEDVNDFWIQSGAEAGDGLHLRFDHMDTAVLGIDCLDVTTEHSAGKAISYIKDGLDKLSSIRSNIGAQQNRLEHTIKHQMINVENTQKAESVIRDTDMAKEMVRHSKEQILQQVGQSVLAQTNQNRQGILSLLQ